MKTEVIYGFHTVFEALNARRRLFHKIFLLAPRASNRAGQIIYLAKALNIDCEIIGLPKMKSITGRNNHCDFAAVVSPLPTINLKDLLNDKNSPDRNFLLILLDGILDPHNFGAIVRTAYCVGASGVIVTKDRSCSPTPAVSKISSGALEHIPICRVTNLVNTIKILQKKGIWVAGLDSSEKVLSIFDSNISNLMAFVVGNENKGLRPLVKRECDFLVSVPMSGKIDSLNASVAAAVVLYESFRQRSPK